jgi:hypothetical protein
VPGNHQFFVGFHDHPVTELAAAFSPTWENFSDCNFCLSLWERKNLKEEKNNILVM